MGHTIKATPTNCLFGQYIEPDSHHIHPRDSGRSKIKVNPFVLLEPPKEKNLADRTLMSFFGLGGVHGNVLRIQPLLMIPQEESQEVAKILDMASQKIRFLKGLGIDRTKTGAVGFLHGRGCNCE